MHKLNKEAWACIGASPTILSWITKEVPLDFHHTPDPCHLPNRVQDYHQRQFVQQEVESLLQKGSICKVNREDTWCVLPLRCIPKKHKKFRLVLDCRHVNECIECPSFSQEGIQAVADQIQEDDDLISVDLESGFHHLPVKIEFQTFLGFYWNGDYYLWCVLAFGIKSAPYFFNKVLRPVLAFLRGNNIRSALFVDDFLFMIKHLVLTDQREFMIQTLEELGWSINYDKSKLLESKSCKFIGFVVHSKGKNGPWLQVTQKKMHKLRQHLNHAIQSETIKARFLAKIGGECIVMMHVVLPAKLLLRNLYRTLSRRSSWDSEVFMNDSCCEDLTWWLNFLKGWNGAPLQNPQRRVQIETDASKTGWGGVCGTLEASGTWSKDVSFQPSNYRELLAILKSIQSFQNVLRKSSVQVLSDNITAVAHINNLGGVTPLMSRLMTTLFVTCHELGIVLSARYLAGRLNGHADGLSRILTPYEWMLHPKLFQVIQDMWGPHTVDRFASGLMCQLPRYNSLYLDPNTEGVVAMMQDWRGENNFVNAPFWMLTKIMRKVEQEGVYATIIAPHWPSQMWFHWLKRMSIGVPLRLPNMLRVMLRRAGVPEPLKNPKWRVYAWRVYGKIN